MAQQQIFVFEARDKNLGALIEQKREQLRRLNKEFKGVEEGTKEYEELSKAIAQTKAEVAGLTDQQKKLNKEFQAMQVPKDSLAGLRLEYSRLSQQISLLSDAERKSDFGKRLIANAAQVKKQVDGIEQSIGRFTGNVGNYSSAFDRLAPVVQKTGFILGGLFAALQGGSAIVNATRETEKFFAVLKNAVGSELRAKEIFAELRDFAATTPFQLNEVVSAFTKLENRNFNPTVEQLRTIGDIAASSGKSIDQFVEAILDAQTGEFERLKEFGIVARKNGDELNVTFRGQATTIKNTSEAISDYLLGLGKLPGIQNAASAVAKTLDGSISNLDDNMTRLFSTIGSGGGILKGFVDSMNFIVGAVNDYLETPLSEELQNEAAEFRAVAMAAQSAGEGTEVRLLLIRQMQAEYPGFLANIDAETVSNEDLAIAIAKTNLEFQKKIVLAANEEKLAAAAQKVTDVVNEQTDAIRNQGKVLDQMGAQAARDAQGNMRFRVEDVSNRGQAAQETEAFRQLDLTVENANQKIQEATNDQMRLQEELSNTFFLLFGQTEEQARAELGLAESRKKGSESTGKQKEENDALAGSLRFLREEIERLEKEIENTPGDSKFLEPLIQRLNLAKKRLDEAEKAFMQSTFRASFGRDLTAPDVGIEEQPTIEIIPELKVDDEVKEDAKEKAARLKKELEKDLEAVEFPIETVLPPGEQAALDAFNEQRKKADDDYYANQKEQADKAAAEELQRREELKAAAINAASEIASSIFQIQQNRINREEQTAIQALENEYNRKIQKAGNNVKKQEALEKELVKKREQIEKDSAKKRKQVAKQEAVIQGALAVVEALPNLVLAAFAAAATIAQIAVIDSTDFAAGGFPKKVIEQRKRQRLAPLRQTIGGYAGAGIAPADSTGRRPAGAYEKGGSTIVYHEGEYIAPASQVERHRPLFNWLEQDRIRAGKKFAAGGRTDGENGEYIAPASQVQRYPEVFAKLNGELYRGGNMERHPDLLAKVYPSRYGATAISYATGGFTLPPPDMSKQTTTTVTVVKTELDPRQLEELIEQMAERVSRRTGESVRAGIAVGLNDKNRLDERMSALDAQRPA